jgi:Do/DeqQ family serine protease
MKRVVGFFCVLILLGAHGGAAKAAESVVPSTREQVTLTFAPVVKKAAPAVVNIYTRRVVRSQNTPLFNDPFFRRFFGDDMNSLFGMPREQVQNSLGSGVIVQSNGIVITNHHVVGNADEITVVLTDRREYEAELIGSDERSDLAVLKLKDVAESLPSLSLSDSENVEVGDMVLAIGNPFGVGQTVTSGIVSALARTTVGISDYRSFIQTDAAINPGNSGGALITSDGRLVGINTAIYSKDGGNVGIGFAIPATMVRSVLLSILKDGRAVRPWLGASGKNITSDLAKGLGLSRPMGVIVDRVVARSPAARAGLAVGDIIQDVDGRSVADTQELRYRLATLPVGGRARLGILRNGEERKVNVALESPPDIPARQETELSGRQPFSGAKVANLNPALAEELGRDYVEPGVIILEVGRGTIASRFVRPGDIVWVVNDEPVKSVDDLMRFATESTAPWAVTLNRNGQAIQFQANR